MKKVLNKLFGLLWKTMKYGFIVFCVFTGSLFFREQKVPDFVIDRLIREISGGDFMITCDDAFFGFRHGMRIANLRIYDRTSTKRLDPVISARSIEIHPLTRKIWVDALRVPFLHDGYYEVTPAKEKNSPVVCSFLDLPPFTLELNRPFVLGVAPESLTCRVSVSESNLDFGDILLCWPDDGERMSLRGFCEVSIDGQCVKGEVKGHARQSHIRPLVERLDVPVALPYMDAFTEVTEPVPAYCSWEVNLINNDFRLALDLKPTMGRYNGVPMSRVDGQVGLHVYTRGTNLNFDTTVGPLKAWNLDGELVLDGQLTVSSTNDVNSIDFDARGHALPKELTTIIDYLNGGSLDVYETAKPIDVSVKGRLAADLERQTENRLFGRVESSDCRFCGIPFLKASVDYGYVGDTVFFTNLTAIGNGGGRLLGSAAVHVPGLDEERDHFELELRYVGGSLAELAEAFDLDLSDKHGQIAAELKLSAPLASNLMDRAVLSGKLSITDGRLWRLKFFDQVTQALHIDKLPGVDTIAGLSDSATASFTASNGVLRIENVRVEGPFVSIGAWGTYDIVKDELDIVAHLHPFRKDVGGKLLPIGMLAHLVTWPVTKTLEYRVTGKPSAPKWQSRWLEKIVDTVKEPL